MKYNRTLSYLTANISLKMT